MIICADVLDGLRSLPDASIDAIVTDPPYGERAASWDADQSIEWWIAWMIEACRALRPNGAFVTFSSRRRVDVVMGALRRVRGDSSALPLQTAAWVHNQGHPVGPGLLRPEHEPIIISGRLRTETDEARSFRPYESPHNVKRKPVHRRTSARGFKEFTYVPHAVGPMAGTVLRCSRNKPSEATGHPTQKPLALMDHLVALSSAPGDLVLDPFAGSGSTGVSALSRGRRFIGIDSNFAYCAKSIGRLHSVAPLLSGRIA